MVFPQVDAARARAFVLAHGSAVDVARMEGLLGRTEPDRAVVKALERLQNPDGGFPAAAVSAGPRTVDAAPAPGTGPEGMRGAHGADRDGASSVAATCEMLVRLRDIPPLAGSPMASRAVAFLRRSQNVDGSWQEVRDGAGSAFQTALAAYTLAVMEPDHPDPIVRAARWLRRTLLDRPGHALASGARPNPAESTEHASAESAGHAPTNGVQPTLGTGAGRAPNDRAQLTPADGGEHAPAGRAEGAECLTLALASAVWGHTGDSAAQDTVHALLERRNLAVPELAGWLTTFVELGLAARHFALVMRLLERLAGMQQPDGSWPGEDGPNVEATLIALRVFRGFALAV